jgi:hypothetical protein
MKFSFVGKKFTKQEYFSIFGKFSIFSLHFRFFAKIRKYIFVATLLLHVSLLNEIRVRLSGIQATFRSIDGGGYCMRTCTEHTISFYVEIGVAIRSE